MSANEKHNLDALPSNYRPFTDAEADAAIKGIVLETAEVMWCYADVFNPYGLPGISSDCIGRDYFARAPSGPWIWFHDLPSDLRDALWQKHEAELAFPAGLKT